MHHDMRNQKSEDVAPEDTTDPESESDQERIRIMPKDSVRVRSEPRPKRTVKPTVRLTYDEPGRSKDQPLTIVHRGIVIKIGQA